MLHQFQLQEEADLSTQMVSGEKVIERSSLFDSPFYQPSAISHQDFLMDYTDYQYSLFKW